MELKISAQIITDAGNIVAAMTRDVSRAGIGLFHRGAIPLGKVTVKMRSEKREFEYDVIIRWCKQIYEKFWMSGGEFASKKGTPEPEEPDSFE